MSTAIYYLSHSINLLSDILYDVAPAYIGNEYIVPNVCILSSTSIPAESWTNLLQKWYRGFFTISDLLSCEVEEDVNTLP